MYNKVYNRFLRVVNFYCGEGVVSLCANSICSGPYRINLSTHDVEEIVYVEVMDDTLILNGSIRLCLKPELRYTCTEFSSPADDITLAKHIKRSYDVFAAKAIPESVYGLLNLKQADAGGVNQSLASYFKRGIAFFKEGDYKEAVLCFKHRGFGLTPAGDDFLIGMLIGMAWLQVVQKKELSKIMDLIIHESEMKDLLIKTFALQALHLDLDSDWLYFLNSLCDSEGDDIPHLEAILSQGSSSGADELSGFYLGCELFGSGFEINILETKAKKEVL
ncbi:MAG: DUF2877 domain-containing protein [Candidatus Cloacimonetes bacterium]|nr:DUF2877 domain-containing protein [Candidatus Cloacimonadota bacterium]